MPFPLRASSRAISHQGESPAGVGERWGQHNSIVTSIFGEVMPGERR